MLFPPVVLWVGAALLLWGGVVSLLIPLPLCGAAFLLFLLGGAVSHLLLLAGAASGVLLDTLFLWGAGASLLLFFWLVMTDL